MKPERMITNLIKILLIFIISICGNRGLLAQQYCKSIMKEIRYVNPCFGNIKAIANITFGEVINYRGGKEELLLDIYAPENDQLLKRRVIVWFHGGGLKPGNDKTQSYIIALSQNFAKRGYVCVAPNYRVRDNPEQDLQGTLEDAMDDVELALRWIRENCKNYQIDPKYVIAGGGSAGGILMSNFFLRKNIAKKYRIKAFVNLWGSPDNLPLNAEEYRHYPPTIFIHGTDDTIVPFKNSELISKCLSDARVNNELYPLPGASHTPVDQMDEIVSQVSRFLNKVY
jgi:acetyl esterase/lipase